MSWRKEHKEHPTFTIAQAKQIAHDHASKRHEHKRVPQKGGLMGVSAATRDFTGLYAGAKRIAYQRKP